MDDLPALAEQWIGDETGWVPAIEAAAFLNDIQNGEDDDRLMALVGWLETQELRIVTDLFRSLRPRRQYTPARHTSEAARFAQTVTAHRDDLEPTEPLWEASYRVGPAEDQVRRLQDMTGADHTFVAGSFQTLGQRALMLATFHRTVARMLGGRRTGDVFDEDKYLRLRQSIARDQGLEAPPPLGVLPPE